MSLLTMLSSSTTSTFVCAMSTLLDTFKSKQIRHPGARPPLNTAFELLHEGMHQFQPEVAVPAIIEVGTHADAIITYRDADLVLGQVQPDANMAGRVVRERVLERIADQFVQDQSARDGLVQRQIHVHHLGFKYDLPVQAVAHH